MSKEEKLSLFHTFPYFSPSLLLRDPDRGSPRKHVAPCDAAHTLGSGYGKTESHFIHSCNSALRRKVDQLSLTSLLPWCDEEQGSLTVPFKEEQAKTNSLGVRF